MFFSWIHIWIHDFHKFIYEFYIWILCQDTSWYTRIHSFSWIHARYHGFWPLFMGEILSEIMSEEYIVKWWKICMNSSLNLIEFMVLCADALYLMGPGDSADCSCCSRATCLTVSLSIPLTSVQVGALPIVLSESHYRTSVPSQQSLLSGLWPIANLKSLMSWNWGLLEVQNITFKRKMYLKVVNHCCVCVCPSAKCDVGQATEWLEYSWIPLR